MTMLPDNFAFLTQDQKNAYYASQDSAPTTTTTPTLSSINQTSGQIEQAYSLPSTSLQRLSSPTAPSTITSSTLQNQAPLNTTQPNITPVYPVSGLNTGYSSGTTTGEDPYALTSSQLEQSQLNKELRLLNEQNVGRSAYQAEQEKQLGISDLLKSQNELSTRLTTLKNEALAIPLQLQQQSIGRGITAGGLQPIETAALRNNAIQALSTNSLLEATRGNITLAQNLADRAVAQRFDPIDEQIKAKEANLKLLLNDPNTTMQEKKQADRIQTYLEAEKERVAQQRADAKSISTTLNTAIEFGLQDTQLMERIGKARTPLEALQLAAPYLQDPAAKLKLEALRLDNEFTRIKMNTERARASEITRKINESGSTGNQAALGSVSAKASDLQNKISAISDIALHPGMASRVGPNAIARSGLGTGLVSTVKGTYEAQKYGDSFAGDVHMLTSGATLQNLIDAKSKGATFGALSNQELGLLIESATKIGGWEIMDDKDRPQGYWDVTEDAFKAELDRLKGLYSKALGTEYSQTIKSDDDLQQLLDSTFDPTVDAITNFNPAY